MTVRLRYIGPFACPTGYGRAGHDYLMALRRAGVDLDIVPIHEASEEGLEERYRDLVPLVLRDEGEGFEPTHVVVHTIPRYCHEFVTGDLAPPAGVKKIALTTWETDRFPAADAKRLDEYFDLVIVPSKFNRVALLRGGMPEDKVATVAHAADPAFWVDPSGGVRPRIEDGRAVVLYSIGVWGSRKNIAGVLVAFWAEFSPAENVVLKLVTPYFPTDEIRLLAARTGLTELPRVELIDRRLTEAELVDLHLSSHAYVSAARGEGWGLGMFEAFLLGNTVISHDFGGQMDFLEISSKHVSYGHQLTPAIADEVQVAAPLEVAGIKITPMARAAPTGIDATQKWAEPDLSQLQARMRHVYRLPPYAGVDRARWTERFSYEAVGERFRNILEAM
jgi:glycosyltransferase involved in cell wall biosynthesis